MVLELEQKKTGHNDFFKPLLCGRLTYMQRCPTEDKVSKLISLPSKLLGFFELFFPIVYKCNSQVPLSTIAFCFSDKEFFISFEFFSLNFFFFFYLFDSYPALCTPHFWNSPARIGCQ